MTPLYLLELDQVPIFEQLQIEEALIRTDHRNVCVLNKGSPPAIVLGLSGNPEELLDPKQNLQSPIPVIRRFSGGGCVIIDEDTLFISFLFNHNDLSIPPFPEPILRWAEELYQNSWSLDQFHLIENDFALGEKKCGGNAQYIQKDRWLIHTSFLWDFQEKNMNRLTLPKKRPAYRQDRPHQHFLCKLKNYIKNPNLLIHSLKATLASRFHLLPFPRECLPSILQKEHRKSTNFI